MKCPEILKKTLIQYCYERRGRSTHFSRSGTFIAITIGTSYFYHRWTKRIVEFCQKKADMILSLSTMTFTHEMVKNFLLEQINRAISILEHRKYHKG